MSIQLPTSAILFVLLLLPLWLSAQNPEIAIIPTFELYAGPDPLIDFYPAEMGATHRQTEVKQLVEQLERYQPTKLVLAIPHGAEEWEQVNFIKYLYGSYSIRLNDSKQPYPALALAYPLARQSGHQRVYGLLGASELTGRYLVKALSDTSLVEVKELRATMEAQARFLRDSLAHQPLGSILTYLRSDAFTENIHETLLAQLAATTADPILDWWRADLEAMTSYLSQTVEPNDRILVLLPASYRKGVEAFVRRQNSWKLQSLEWMFKP